MIKINKEKNKIILVATGLTIITLFALFFAYLFFKSFGEVQEKNKIENMEDKIEKALSKERPKEGIEPYPLLLNRLKREGVSRYFLSEIELIENVYVVKTHSCLYDENNNPLYPKYFYETWSLLDYPKEDPKIGLIRYSVLPEDNSLFNLDKNCYIEEIKSESQWEAIKKYNFYKDRFIN